jgi:hypothetical protein
MTTKKKGSDFVYVNIDGTIRELTNDEIAYLSEDFHPNDGGRPYIKLSYEQLTPDNKIWGFLLRKNIPINMKIKADEK